MKIKLTQLSLLFLFGILFFFLWNALLTPLYINYENYNPEFRNGAALVNGADMAQQMHLILHGGWYFFDVIVKSAVVAFDMYFNGFIGTFGWLELSVPFTLVVTSYFVIVLLAFADSDRQLKVGFGTRFVFLFSFALILLLVLLSQHLIWDYVGADAILTLQGRYFIPFVPLIFPAFYIKFFEARKLSMVLSVTVSLVCLAASLQLLMSRYIY